MNPLIGLTGLISTLSTFLVVFVWSISRVSSMKPIIRLVGIYSIFSALADSLLQFLPADSSHVLLFCFTLVEYACFAWLFMNLLTKPASKKVIEVGSVLFLVVVSYSLSNFGEKNFDSVNSGTEAILIIIYSILYFSEKLSLEKPEPVFEDPGAFLVVGCLFYLAGNLFLFITSDSQTTSIWLINSIFNMLRNVFFLMAIRKCTKPQPVSVDIPFSLKDYIKNQIS